MDDFDVPRFANMDGKTGASYVVFTIGHAKQYCPAPIERLEIGLVGASGAFSSSPISGGDGFKV